MSLYSFSISLDSLLDVLIETFAILPWFNVVIVAYIEDIENIGQMTSIIPIKNKDIMLWQ